MKKQLFKCTLLLLAFVLFIPARGWPIDAKRVVLPNGLTLLFSEKHNLPIVKATMLIKASPINEPAEKAGLANLTAELLLEGTKTRTSEEISEAIEFIGGDLSVSTERDYTELELSILKKDIKTGFSILSDILLNPVFSENEITRKKDIIKGALRQREEDPSFLGSRAFRKAVFSTSHPYGRIIEGSTNTLDMITREDIIDFHKNWYRPNNAILSVVGDISFDELNGLIQEFFGTWKPYEAPAPTIPPVTVPAEPKTIPVEKDLTQANIFLGHLGVKRSNTDYYALSVMNYILGGGGFASRLMTRIRDDLGLAYDVHSYFTSNLFRGAFLVGVQTKNRSAKDVIRIILEEIKRIQKEPVTDEELMEAKSYLTGSFPRRLDTMGKVARFLALTEFYGLGLDYDMEYKDLINSVTKDDVLRVARKYLHPDAYTLVIVADLEKAGFNEKQSD